MKAFRRASARLKKKEEKKGLWAGFARQKEKEEGWALPTKKTETEEREAASGRILKDLTFF